MMTVELECGFKETEVGVIPFDWTVAALGSIADLTMGQSPPSSTYNTKGDGLPFFQGKAEFGALYPVIEKWCSQPQRVAETGSVLVSVRAPVGDVNIAPSRCCIGRGLASIKARAQADNMYLFYFLLSAKSRLELEGTGTTFKSINKAVLQNFMISLPPLPEQRRIAAVLNAIQDAIAAQEDIIAEARALKRSLMQRLFTYGPGREPAETRETEIGEIPAHWEVTELERVSEIDYGIQAAVAHMTDPSSGTPILTNVNITLDSQVDLRTLRYYPLPEKKRDKILQRGDVLFNWRSGSQQHVGKSALFDFDEEYTFSSFILRFRPRHEIQSRYLAHYLHYLRESGFYAQRRGQSSVNSVINASAAAKLPVVFPPIDYAGETNSKEQERIVGILDAANAKIAAEEDRKTALQDLFNSTLHQLMTGQIRLLSDEGLPL